MSLLTMDVKTLAGEATTLAEYAGKVLVVVNVASKCGFTPQYAGLEALYAKYKDQGLVVLGFPSNDFGNQEPGSPEEIASFCDLNYGVTFPMFEKIAVTGAAIHPLYRSLTADAPVPETNGDTFRKGLENFAAANGLPAPAGPPAVMWNFEKFVVGREGEVLARFATEVTPDDPRVIAAVESALTA